jgi:hypothetical protein
MRQNVDARRDQLLDDIRRPASGTRRRVLGSPLAYLQLYSTQKQWKFLSGDVNVEQGGDELFFPGPSFEKQYSGLRWPAIPMRED